jgi:signal peptidase II
MSSRLRPYLTFWVVGLLAVATDIGTKLLVIRKIPFGTYFESSIGEPIHVFPGFDLVHIGNKGAAWGIGSEHAVRPFLVFLAAAILVLIWRWRQPLLRELQGGQVAFGLFVGGTLGNVRDRIFGEHVTDFLAFTLPFNYRFPAFNVADSCICVGVSIYIIMSYRHDSARREAIVSQGGEDPPKES